MTKEEAQKILNNVACPCDGLGIVPGPHGVAVSCPNCDGQFVSDEQWREARLVMAEDSS